MYERLITLFHSHSHPKRQHDPDLANCGKTRLERERERGAELAGARNQQRRELRWAHSCSFKQGAWPNTRSRGGRGGQVLCCRADTETTTQTPRMTAPAPRHSPPLAPPRILIGRPGPSPASHWFNRRPHRPGWRGLSWLAGLAVASSNSSLRSSYPRCTKPRPEVSSLAPAHPRPSPSNECL